MRKLHLVGFTPDRKGLIYSARRGSKSGGFLVPIEDSLVARIEEATRGTNGDDGEASPAAEPVVAPVGRAPGRPRTQSALTPREMQSRLRAGRTIAEVAAEANADPEWVERFAIPILAEQAQMVELARSLTYVKSRRGESAEPLGPSVAENLAERGVQLPDDLFDAAWSAYQLHDAVWVVRVRYRSRGRPHEAAWELNVATGQLTSRNRLASELGYIEKGRRRRPAPRLDTVGAPEAAAEGVITRRASVSRSKAQTDGGTRRKARSTATKARRPASKRAPKAASAGRARAERRPASPSIARAPTASKAKPAAKAKPATTKAKAAARGPSSTKASTAKARSGTATKRTAAKTRSGGAARRPPTASAAARPAKAAKRAATRSGGTRSRGRKAVVTEKPLGPAGPARADGSPLPLSADGVSPGVHTTEGSAPPPGEERPRLPINRLAATRVAASRAAAARLSDDRRPANPVPPSAADAVPPHRSAPVARGGGTAPRRAPAPPPAAAPSPADPAVREPEPPPRPRKPSVADLVFEDLLEPDEPSERLWAGDEVTTGERPVIAAERVGASPSSEERSRGRSREFGTASPWPVHAG